MAYTAVEFRPTSEPLVAIYSRRDGSFEAFPILGYAIYRDPEQRGGDNYLVPVGASGLVAGQRHHFGSARVLVDALPYWVVLDPDLYAEAVLETNVQDAGAGLYVEQDLETRTWKPEAPE